MSLEVPSTHAELVAFFKVNIACPLPIKEGEEYQDLARELLWLWKDIMDSHAMNHEDKYLCDDDEETDFQLNEDDVDELRPLAFNLATWIENAREEFIEECEPLSLLIANKDVYAKHILTKKMSFDEIRQLALRKRISYLYSHIDNRLLKKILLKGSVKFFQEIISERKIRFSIKCDIPVGVTDTGDESNCLMVEIDTSSRIAHAYPCSPDEAVNNVKTLIRKAENQIRDEDDLDETVYDTEVKLTFELNLKNL